MLPNLRNSNEFEIKNDPEIRKHTIILLIFVLDINFKPSHFYNLEEPRLGDAIY